MSKTKCHSLVTHRYRLHNLAEFNEILFSHTLFGCMPLCHHLGHKSTAHKPLA